MVFNHHKLETKLFQVTQCVLSPGRHWAQAKKLEIITWPIQTAKLSSNSQDLHRWRVKSWWHLIILFSIYSIKVDILLKYGEKSFYKWTFGPGQKSLCSFSLVSNFQKEFNIWSFQRPTVDYRELSMTQKFYQLTIRVFQWTSHHLGATKSVSLLKSAWPYDQQPVFSLLTSVNKSLQYWDAEALE